MTRAPNFRRRRLAAAFAHVSLALAALAMILLASAAQAQQFDYSAVIAGQGRVNGPVNAGGIVWQCNPRYCTTRGPWPVPGVNSCSALAKIVGPLASYGYQGRMLSPNDMKVCNGNQTATTYQAPNSNQPSGQQPQPANQSAAAINPLGALFQNLANANGGSGGQNTQGNSNAQPANTNTSSSSASGSNSGSSGSSSAAPAPTTSTAGSISFRTAGLTVTGTGALAPTGSRVITIHTKSLRVTGTGMLAPSAVSGPIRIRATTLTVTGTGSL